MVISAATSAELAPLITFSYSKQPERVLPRSDASVCNNIDSAKFEDKYLTSSDLPDAAVMGDVALLATKYQGSCWTDDRYNDKNVKVEKGTLKAGDKSYTAYQSYPATDKASKLICNQYNQY